MTAADTTPAEHPRGRLLSYRATDGALVLLIAMADQSLRLVRLAAADAPELAVLNEPDRSRAVGALAAVLRGAKGGGDVA